MSVSTTRARHRAARRPSTPLSELATVATGQMSTVGKRTAVVAASSALVVSTLAAPAVAAAPASSEPAGLGAVDTDVLTASARAVLAAAPVVTAPVEATWTFDAPAVTAVAPPPPPPPPAPVVERRSSTSRSAARAATATATQATEGTADAAAEAAPAEVASAAVPAAAAGSSVIEVAAQYVGVPYVYGGTTPAGFDCSGFIGYVYRQLGVSLPRTSSGIKAAGTVISAADAQPGDLIWSPGHISIYAGGGQQIDAPRPGKTIQFRSIWQSSPVYLRIG